MVLFSVCANAAGVVSHRVVELVVISSAVCKPALLQSVLEALHTTSNDCTIQAEAVF